MVTRVVKAPLQSRFDSCPFLAQLEGLSQLSRANWVWQAHQCQSSKRAARPEVGITGVFFGLGQVRGQFSTPSLVLYATLSMEGQCCTNRTFFHPGTSTHIVPLKGIHSLPERAQSSSAPADIRSVRSLLMMTYLGILASVGWGDPFLTTQTSFCLVSS